jgi:hypothetical protein
VFGDSSLKLSSFLFVLHRLFPSAFAHHAVWHFFESRVSVLDAFTEPFQRAIVSFVMSICLSVRMEQLGSHWTDFHEILC